MTLFQMPLSRIGEINKQTALFRAFLAKFQGVLWCFTSLMMTKQYSVVLELFSDRLALYFGYVWNL